MKGKLLFSYVRDYKERHREILNNYNSAFDIMLTNEMMACFRITEQDMSAYGLSYVGPPNESMINESFSYLGYGSPTCIVCTLTT